MPNTAASSNGDSGLKQKWEGFINQEADLLNLSMQGISNEHISILLSFLDEHPEVTSLRLWQNQIGDDGTTALAGNTSLRSLNLDGNQIGDAGATALAGNTSLTSLSLWFNNIGDAGAIAFAGSTSLRSLELGVNRIGDAGAIALAASTSLRFLELGINRIGDAGREAFNKPVAERVIAARDKGAKIGLPSLYHLCIFALNKNGKEQEAVSELKEKWGLPDNSPLFTKEGTFEEGARKPEVRF